ncbi:unnamed protein product [Cylindrotheca closterium]|uniref:Uncharacterized protein n=1 Tax=Cylindrotheca closterium TaxID=2856 RepID=A0AAD2FR19_9STRA|nr:unnamed protein product [Cylindrotheca closterium]
MTENHEDESQSHEEGPSDDETDASGEFTISEIIENSSVSSKSTTSRTRRENERLRLANEQLKVFNEQLKKANKGRSNDSDIGSNSTRSSSRSSTRREIERLHLENDKLRSEMADLQQAFRAILQTSDVPSAAPVPDIVDVEVFRPADREELLSFQIERLNNLVQALQMDNEDLRSLLVGKSSRGSGGSVASSIAVAPISLWETYRTQILKGGAVVIVVGAVAYFFWPVLCEGSGGRAAIAQMVFETGTSAEVSIEPAPTLVTAEKAAKKTTCSVAASIAAATIGMLQVSQNGVGLPGEDDYY